MNSILTTLAIGSAIVLGGCNKTKDISTAATATQAGTQDVNLAGEVTVENGEMKVMVNGEERSIGDLSEIMGGIDFGGGDENIEVHIARMMGNWDGEEDGNHEYVMRMTSGDGAHQDGKGVHIIKMMDGDGGHPEGMREHMMGGGDGHPEGMREQMVIMMDGKVGLSNLQHPIIGEWRIHEDRDIPEEHQFLEELSMLEEISATMSPQSMVMLGIHMIRDELEPEARLEALERIIEEASNATSRNAALIVAIETLQELDRQDEAVDLMVELVLSN
jgi:hypothetical protein